MMMMDFLITQFNKVKRSTKCRLCIFLDKLEDTINNNNTVTTNNTVQVTTTEGKGGTYECTHTCPRLLRDNNGAQVCCALLRDVPAGTSKYCYHRHKFINFLFSTCLPVIILR